MEFGNKQYREIEPVGHGTYGTVVLVERSHRSESPKELKGDNTSAREFEKHETREKHETHETHEKRYIVKKMLYEDDNVSHDILKEIDTLKRFGNHPNIVDIIGLNVLPKSIHILQPYKGITLRTFIKDFSSDTRHKIAKNVFTQIMSAIDYLHRNNVLHRDIKSDNILINYNSGSSNVTLCDFGLSKVKVLRQNTPKVCSLSYRPPELLLKHKEYTESIDVWAFGCVMYEYLAGICLFRGTDKKDLLRKIIDCFGMSKNTAEYMGLKYNEAIMTCHPTTRWTLFKDIPQPFRSLLISYVLQIDPRRRFTISEIALHLNYRLQHIQCKPLDSGSGDCCDYVGKWYPDNQQRQNTLIEMREDWFRKLWNFAVDSNMQYSTIYLTFSIFDRYLSSFPSVPTELTDNAFQYLSLSCLHLASKFLEIHSLKLTDLGYRKKSLRKIYKIQKDILCRLDWVIYTPSHYDVLVSIMPHNTHKCNKLARYMYMNYDISSRPQKEIVTTLKRITNTAKDAKAAKDAKQRIL